MDIRLRPADHADLHFVLEGMRGLAATEGRPGAVTVSVERLAELLDGPGGAECLIAERGSEPPVPIGHAWWFVKHRTFTGQPVMWLEDLHIAPEHRGRGVGRAVMTLLARRARRAGMEGIAWTVEPGNDRAMAFYERLGAARAGSVAMGMDRAAIDALADGPGGHGPG